MEQKLGEGRLKTTEDVEMETVNYIDASSRVPNCGLWTPQQHSTQLTTLYLKYIPFASYWREEKWAVARVICRVRERLLKTVDHGDDENVQQKGKEGGENCK